jgi:predicted AlkP superfamily pyrophosphatase or phosphodiesterase
VPKALDAALGRLLMQKLILALLLFAATLPAQQNRLLVISIDGLDHRWLRDADALGLKIPTLRRLMHEGARADGVVGIVPTVTWPSHTTMVTGAPAWEHGIVSNNQPGKPGQRWWYATFLKRKTLWDLAGEKGLKTAAVWWPVTTGARIDFNLPEFWDDADLKPYAFAPMARHATLGLVEKIRRRYPAFGQDFSDPEKALGARAILETEKPDLMLLHLGDLDSAQHETGAFSEHSKEILEKQDALLAQLIEALPPQSYVVVASDHGFETQQHVLRPAVLLAEAGIEGAVEIADGLIGSADAVVAAYLRSLIGKADSPIAREVSIEEVHTMAPALKHWRAAFETAAGTLPARGSGGPALGEGDQRGYHGLWPTRADYRASFVIWGPGIRPQVLPEMSMLDIAPTFADLLGLPLSPVVGKSWWHRLK